MLAMESAGCLFTAACYMIGWRFIAAFRPLSGRHQHRASGVTMDGYLDVRAVHGDELNRKLRAHWTMVCEPERVPTRMGGPGAPDDLTMGHLTQTWLAVGEEPAAKVSGGYWYHRKRQEPAAAALDPAFQDRLIARLAQLTGISLF